MRRRGSELTKPGITHFTPTLEMIALVVSLGYVHLMPVYQSFCVGYQARKVFFLS